MERGLTGHYVDSIAGGVRCQAFPDPLPPQPPLALDGKLQGRIKAEKGKLTPAKSRRRRSDNTAKAEP